MQFKKFRKRLKMINLKIKTNDAFIIFVVLLGLIFSFGKILAEDSSEKYNEIKTKLDVLTQEMNQCNSMPSGQPKIDCIDKVRKEMEDVMSELKKYEEEIGAKQEKLQKDIKSLSNQIGYLNAQVEKTEVEVRITQQEIDLINFDIEKIEEQIKITEEDIKNTENEIVKAREQLAATIKNLYEYDNQNLIKITLTNGNLSDFFDEVTYIESLQKGIGENLEKLKKDKQNLEAKKTTLEEQKASLAERKREVAEKIDSFNKIIAELDASKREKATLLEITKGDEAEYQKLLEKIKKETSALSSNLNQLLQLRQDTLIEYLKQSPVLNNCNSSIKVPYFAQTDPIWAGRGIGNSGITVGGYGCALTSVAMVFNYYKPSITNPGIIAAFPSYPHDPSKCDNWCGCSGDGYVFTSGGCINWWEIGQQYGFTIDPLSFGLDWNKINSEINQGHPVIVKTSSSAVSSHYVVIVGRDDQDYIVLDPYRAVLKNGIPIGGCVYLHQSLAFAANNGIGSVNQMVIYHP